MFRASPLLLAATTLLLLAIASGCNPAGSTDYGPVPTQTAPTAAPLPTATMPASAPMRPTLMLGIRDGAGAITQRTVDGNALQLVADLGVAAKAAMSITFSLEGEAAPVSQCDVMVGERTCTTIVHADGWAWQDRTLVGLRKVVATNADGQRAEMALAVTPKPVVLVHGLNSDHTSWINWIKPDGFLANVGMPGYAVDDGQFGTRSMNTGNPSRPLDGTNSIAENALILAEYVEAVRVNTGAERIDLVAHSLGGLISRYYVQNLMPLVQIPGLADVPVANQLFMAGTPNGGTPCGRIPAAVGLFSPATTQITPEYLAQVFNPAVNDRRGVPFFALAGDAVREKIAIRCTDLPTDRYVSVQSVLRGVSVSPNQVPGFHSDLNNGRTSFEIIFASLARSPHEYPIDFKTPTSPLSGVSEDMQSTLVQGGTLRAGETITLTITLDQAREASFILYAPGSRVTMTIKTVAGAILTEETPATNPNVTFERVLDDDTPLSLGYGVLNPRAGAWEIGLTAQHTPQGGGPFALVASLQSDLRLNADVSPDVARVGQPVTVLARLESAGALQATSALALASTGPRANEVVVDLFDDGRHEDGAADDGLFSGTWTPTAGGEHTVQVIATGTDAIGNPFERLSLLGVSVR